MTVDSALLKPLLPDGDNISQAATEPNGGTDRCDVSVDGETVLIARQSWRERTDTAGTVARSYLGMGNGELSEDNRFMYTGTEATGSPTSCASADHPDMKLFTVIETRAEDIDDRDAMNKLIVAYTKAVERTDACA
ncbi:hypothetical protein [Streptomyces sp. SCSIO ZS0520]|uniref:hypothetical protein n=1 Tax=Streptomyces sp. SCSIO ZS0520 TaxID=2892996 RepID=UPI0021D82E4B|nr:hypothetical protein [Streptomyces sp. SCSIO ZS0520]